MYARIMYALLNSSRQSASSSKYIPVYKGAAQCCLPAPEPSPTFSHRYPGLIPLPRFATSAARPPHHVLIAHNITTTSRTPSASRTPSPSASRTPIPSAPHPPSPSAPHTVTLAPNTVTLGESRGPINTKPADRLQGYKPLGRSLNKKC